MAKNIQEQIKKIRRAYDRIVNNYRKGVRDVDLLPEKFKHSATFLTFQEAHYVCNSGVADIKKFLHPKKGMNFLDVGSCVNLINYALYKWPSIYYGIDISKKLIEASQNYVLKNNIKIGGLFVAQVVKMPFQDNFFDIASCIGVLEYFDMKYISRSLRELYRVLKPSGKIVLDFPNLANPDTQIMIQFETY